MNTTAYFLGPADVSKLLYTWRLPRIPAHDLGRDDRPSATAVCSPSILTEGTAGQRLEYCVLQQKHDRCVGVVAPASFPCVSVIHPIKERFLHPMESCSKEIEALQKRKGKGLRSARVG